MISWLINVGLVAVNWCLISVCAVLPVWFLNMGIWSVRSVVGRGLVRILRLNGKVKVLFVSV